MAQLLAERKAVEGSPLMGPLQLFNQDEPLTLQEQSGDQIYILQERPVESFKLFIQGSGVLRIQAVTLGPQITHVSEAMLVHRSQVWVLVCENDTTGYL